MTSIFHLPVIQDYQGNIQAETVTATLVGSASTVTNPLIGDVIGPIQATELVSIRGKPVQAILDSYDSLSNATSYLMPQSLVKRGITDSDIVAKTITANIFTGDLIGEASTVNTFTSSFSGDISGTISNTVVESVGGKSVSQITEFCDDVNKIVGPFALLKRDNAGNLLGENTITSSHFVGEFIGIAESCTNWSDPLIGDLTGSQSATVVTKVNNISASRIANVCNNVSNASDINNPLGIVQRDINGNFAANEIIGTGGLFGTFAPGAVTSTVLFNGALAGNVTGKQNLTLVNNINGRLASDIASRVSDIESASSNAINNTLVKTDANGSFAVNELNANILTGTLIGTASSIGNFTNALNGDVTGSQLSTIVTQLGPSNSKKTALQVADTVNILNGADSVTTPSTISKRDINGNIWLNQITAQKFIITSNTPTTTVSNFTGFFNGDMTDSQSTTLIKSIGSLLTSSILLSVGKMIDMSKSNYLRSPVAIGTAATLKNTILTRTPMVNGSSGGAIVGTQYITEPTANLAEIISYNGVIVTNVKGSCTASAGLFRITLASILSNVVNNLVLTLNPIPGTTFSAYPVLILSPADAITANVVINGGGIYAIPIMAAGGIFQLFQIMTNTLGINPNPNVNRVITTTWSYKILWIK
jgi:hypothetical protein